MKLKDIEIHPQSFLVVESVQRKYPKARFLIKPESEGWNEIAASLPLEPNGLVVAQTIRIRPVNPELLQKLSIS